MEDREGWPGEEGPRKEGRGRRPGERAKEGGRERGAEREVEGGRSGEGKRGRGETAGRRPGEGMPREVENDVGEGLGTTGASLGRLTRVVKDGMEILWLGFEL